MRWIKEYRSIGFIIIFVVSAFASFALRSNESFRPIFPLVYSWLLTVCLAVIITVIVHNLGHLLAGFLVGYHFFSFTVLYLHVYRENNNLSIRWLKSQLYRDRQLGLVRFTIPDFDNFRQRMFGYILGGPLATALMILIAGVFYANHPPLPPGSTPAVITSTVWWQLILPLGLLLVGLWGLILTLYSKLSYILLLLRGGPALERYQLLVELANAAAQGVRPKDWDSAWIGALQSFREHDPTSITARLMLYYWALDQRDIQGMKAALPTAIEPNIKLSEAERAEISVEAAYVEICDPTNAQNVEQLLNKLGKLVYSAEPITRMRLACAANLAMHKYAEAQQVAEKVLQLIVHENANSGTTVMERDLFREMGDKARQAQEVKGK